MVLHNLWHNQNGVDSTPHLGKFDLALGEELYAVIPGHTAPGIFRATPGGQLVAANETLAHMLGYESLDALMHSDNTTLSHRFSVEPGWWDELVCILLTTHDILTFESRYWRKDGTLMTGKLHTYATRDTGGSIRYLEGLIEDMSGKTDPRAGQPAEIPAPPPQVREVIERLSDFVCVTDPHGRVRYYNRAARSLLGIGEHEPLATYHLRDAHPPWASARILSEGFAVAAREESWSGETAIVLEDGSEAPVWQVVVAHRTPEKHISGFSMIARVIHEQQRAEKAARCFQQTISSLVNGEAVCPEVRSVGEVLASSKRFLATDTLQVVISLEQELLAPFMAVPYLATFDERPAPFYIGSRIRRMLGYSVAEWLSDENLWLDRVCPGDHEHLHTLYAAMQKSDTLFFSIEYRIRNRKNRVVWIWDGGVVLRRSASVPLCVCGVMLDITERKRADQEFRMLYPLIQKAYSSRVQV